MSDTTVSNSTSLSLKLARESLLTPLQLVIGVVERKQTLPILANVLLNVSGEAISVTGTDLEVELVGKHALEASAGNGALTVPGRKLFDICRALPEGAMVELQQEQNKITIKSGRSRFTLSTLPANDFPKIEEHDSQLKFSIPQAQLLHLMQSTHFAMAQQDVRYYLNGMLFEAFSGTLRAVATDGHRLATNIVKADLQTEHRLQIIVPRKGIVELMRLLNDSDDVVTVTIGNNHLQIDSDSFVFTSKLVEGRFPDYKRVIPKRSKQSFNTDKDLLKQALQRTAILSNEKFHGVRFEVSNDLLKIHANNPEHEAAEEELNISYTGDALDIGFNVNYLLDILNTVNSGDVKLSFTDSNSSVLIEHVDNESAVFVVMPMRI